MPLGNEDKPRKVIPRWRDYWNTALSGELGDIRARDVVEPQETADRLQRRRAEWLEHRTVSFAADYLSSAVALGDGFEARDAAEFILDCGSGVPVTLSGLAALVLAGEVAKPRQRPSVPPEQEIGRLRQQVHRSPRNCFNWVDLARQYAAIGMQGRALRAIRVALDLGPDQRFVLRSAARLLVHIGEFEAAHDLLARSAVVRRDPWLLGAEIAVAAAAGKSSRFIRDARSILLSQQIAPLHVSELASAMGTVELEHGSIKASRRLLRTALVEPTENSAAQVAWAARQVELPLDPVEEQKVRRSPEANAWASFRSGDWDTAVQECRNWLSDQTFSSRPAQFGSFVAGVCTADYRGCEEFASRGLRANPGDFLLANNRAFALAQMNRAREADRILRSVLPSVDSEVRRLVSLATGGLICYRLGDAEAGRWHYENSIKLALALGDEANALIAEAFFCLEELRCRAPGAEEMRAKFLLKHSTNTEPALAALVRHVASRPTM